MIEKTINQKVAARKETRGEASEYFFEPFNIDKKLIISGGVDLKEEDISISGYKKYQYMNFIFTNVMSSNNFEQFVMSMCILRQEASKKLGFDDEFDWVNHACMTGQLLVGKKDKALQRCSWIHAGYNLIKHYEIKCWKILLDAQNGNTEELYKIVPFLQQK